MYEGTVGKRLTSLLTVNGFNIKKTSALSVGDGSILRYTSGPEKGGNEIYATSSEAGNCLPITPLRRE